jgi:type I restriction enzyme S subunit
VVKPPLTEQRRIADVLDQADAIRRKRMEAIALTEELLRSAFLDMFGDPVTNPKRLQLRTFGDAPIEIIDGDRGAAYPTASDFMPSGHCLFLSAKNVTRRGFDFSERQFIGVDRDQALRKGKLRRGDVVLTTRGTLGNSAFFSPGVAYDHVRINSGMLILRAEPAALRPEFLYFFLRSPHFLIQVQQAQSGSAQPQLPVRTLSRMSMLLPAVSYQDKCIATFHRIEALRELLAAPLAEADTLFGSLVSRAFHSGAIRASAVAHEASR